MIKPSSVIWNDSKIFPPCCNAALWLPVEHEVALALTQLPELHLKLLRATGVITRVMRSATRGFRWARLVRGKEDQATFFISPWWITSFGVCTSIHALLSVLQASLSATVTFFQKWHCDTLNRRQTPLYRTPWLQVPHWSSMMSIQQRYLPQSNFYCCHTRIKLNFVAGILRFDFCVSR